MSYDDRYPELGQFLGGYFYQDWADDKRIVGGSFEDVVRYFVAMNPAATVSQATRELEEFMELDLSEKELEEIVYEDLKCFVHAPGLGLTYRQWLEAILAILKSEPPGKSRGHLRSV